MRARRFELFMGCLGNGITVCNKAVYENGDYKIIAHISPEGEIKWRVADDYCPPEARARIEAAAQRQAEDYRKWYDSLPEDRKLQMRLDRMPLAELCEAVKRDGKEERR